ncbi:MAG: hypothetical protein ACI8TX_003772, partial [Hyphomicrobiaceae bacterium]
MNQKNMRNLICSILCLCLPGATLSRAAETDQIKQLTVEEAKLLAQDKSGRLLLDGLTTLSPEVATELARHEGWLSLGGLTTVSDEASEALGAHKGYLHLDGLKKISDASAQSLARHNGQLSLDGLTSISGEAAKAIAQHRGGQLSLKGLTTLSSEAAVALAQRNGGGPTFQVALDGLATLSPEAAAALAPVHPHRWNGNLPGFKTVPVDVARALAKREHGLSFEGLTQLSDEAAIVLGKKLSGNLPALSSLSPEVAKALSQTRGHLVLNSLTTLSDEAAKALTEDAQNRGDLFLNGLTKLSPETARSICRREGDLYLNGLTTISDETLKALAEHKAHPHHAKPLVYFGSLTTLSGEGATVLAEWPKWSGELPALTALSEHTATALAASRNWKGKLPAVKTLSVEAARALAQHSGPLSVDGLTTISEEVAAALAQHHGGTLSLDGLKTLSDKAARALAQHDGRLTLDGLATLSPGADKELAKHRGDWLFLDGLTSLPDSAAKSLAQHQGVVSLRGLNKYVGRVSRPVHPNAIAKTHPTQQFVTQFLDTHCADCHDADTKKGDFNLDILSEENIAGRVAYASMLERLRAGDMPPTLSKKPRPDPAAAAGVIKWIGAKLDSPLAAPATYFAVKEKPIDGNRLPNAILFGGPREPSVPPPPRLWRLSPTAYSTWAAAAFNVHGLQQPFGLIQESGFKDFATLYAPDEGASGLLLSNAEQIVTAQVRGHQLVNVNKDPEAAKQSHWPDEGRTQTATAQEREHLKGGVRVRGNGVFAALLHPQVKANRDELERALQQQFKTSVARPPSEKEIESLIALYDDVASDGDCSLAGKTLLMAPLIVPEAILRFEVGLGAEVRPGVRMLSPRETATALSLALSRKRDPGLLAAAAEGKLTSREEVAETVQRILDEPKIEKSRVMGFFREYFDYHRAPEVFKDPLPNHRTRRGVHYNPRGYVSDTDVLVMRILSRDRDVLKQLLTTPESYRTHELFIPNQTLDGLRYADSPLFRQFSPMALDHRREQQGDRIGILMQPSWQVAWSTNFHNDIVRRGRWVREHLLGGRVPDLPIDAAAMIPDDPHKTLRERQMVTRDA